MRGNVIFHKVPSNWYVLVREEMYKSQALKSVNKHFHSPSYLEMFELHGFCFKCI